MDRPSTPPPHRPSIKAPSSEPSPGFRKRLRTRVLARVRDVRSEEIDRRRASPKPTMNVIRDLVSSELGDMRTEEAEAYRSSMRLKDRAIKLNEMIESRGRGISCESDDDEIAEMGESFAIQDVDVGEADEDFIIDFAAEIEREIDLECNEEEISSQWEDQERFEAEELIAMLSLADDTPVFTCPSCKQGTMREDKMGNVVCNCGLSLTSENGPLSLERLAADVDGCKRTHAKRCQMIPALSVENRFDLPPTLFISCSYCEFMEAVMF